MGKTSTDGVGGEPSSFYNSNSGIPPPQRGHGRNWYAAVALAAFAYLALHSSSNFFTGSGRTQAPANAVHIIAQCRALDAPVAPPPNFRERSKSDRFVPGTRAVLIKDAKLWTGNRNGTEILRGDVLLDNGIIKTVGGALLPSQLQSYGEGLDVIDAKGAWVTPGIVDIHSHLGDSSLPELSGAVDDNSEKATIQPWLRSLDGLNTHDESYQLTVSGGVTTALILPGSANAIGGQAFVIKLRETKEKSPTSMLVEPPETLYSSIPDADSPPRWRHMKHACGENPSSQYNDTRMDTFWAFREAYDRARRIKQSQDDYCAKALAGKWDQLGAYPEDLEWEALVDVLRGKVKVNVHCYEAVDLDALVRLSNEFKFPIAAVHHASEAYLVPDLLKRAYGEPPAVALFAANSRYKREAYRASEFAPRILARNGLKVLMKSDHPVMNSRYLLYEAQQAHYYGLPYNLALASVTSNSAEAMGMGHRLGYIREGWDADIVIWDSHPLALGATPIQVFVDGIAQLEPVYRTQKPSIFQNLPDVPNFDAETNMALRYDGLPPLAPKKKAAGTVIFQNVNAVYARASEGLETLFVQSNSSGPGTVVTQNGKVMCIGNTSERGCISAFDTTSATLVDLEGGSISPGLVSFGSPLGLQHIELEPSTNDGQIFDPLVKSVPEILGGDTFIAKASDGLQFASRDALLAYRAGVTIGVTAPSHSRFYAGLGTAFSLGAQNRAEKGANVQEVTGLHVTVRHFPSGVPSVSTQIAALRRLLIKEPKGAVGVWFDRVREGEIPLIVEAHSVDVIATLLILRREVELETGYRIRLTITGASEAHLLAKELAAADVGVILNPARPFPVTWEQRRILPGPPLTRDSAIHRLLAAGVTVGIGCQEIWEARNLPFDLGWAAIESGGKMSKKDAIALASTNLNKLLGIKIDDATADMVATVGGDIMDMTAKVGAILSPRAEGVYLI
ncbi:hypothetical protein AX16_000728 [Volvariella volvacea WC 439]|nr:hypothetical protein AX16_000728 [Volvariella volvacea WC 439]